MKNKRTNIVYMVRHGENPANITGEFSYKKVDYSLTAKGCQQAEQTGVYFRTQQIDAIYSSPLKRAHETAIYIAAEVRQPVQIIEHFREINVGILEDMPPLPRYWELHNRIVNSWLNGNHAETFPSGENYYSLLARMRNGLMEATKDKDGQRIVITGHGGIFTRTIKDICPEANIEEILYHENQNCSVSILEVTCDKACVRGSLLQWASTSHLQGEATQQAPGTRLLPRLKSSER